VRLTVRTKTALLITSLVLALVGATGWWQYRELSTTYVKLMREQQQALTDSAAADLDYKLGMHLAVLQRAARQIDAQTFTDPAAQRRFFAEAGLRPMFDGTALVVLEGIMVVNDPPVAKPVNVADRDYFKRARDAAEPAISPPLLVRTTNQPVVVMAVPAKGPDGRVVGVLSAILNLQRANVLGDLSRAKVGRNGYYVVVTRGESPLIVMHPDAKLLLKPAGPGTVAAADVTETDLTTHTTIRSADWELRVVVPAGTAYAPLQRAKRALLLQLLWLGLGCAVLVWLGTAWVMRPFAALTAAIRTLRRSPDSLVKLDVVANDERGDLAREFDALMAELRNQRAELTAVTDASPLGLFRCDTEGRITYANDAYLAIHGLPRENAAEGWLTLLHADIREQVRGEWLRLVNAAEPVNAIRRLHRADGTDVLVSMRSRPVLANGRVVGHVGTVSDITERTRAERALRTLGAIFDTTTDFVVQLDAKGRLTYMNPAARRRTGVGLEAPIEHLTMADFNPPQALRRLLSEIVPAAVANGVWVGESQVWDAQRHEFSVSHMVIAHRDSQGKLEYFSALMRDISAAKSTEQALQESEARLRTVADALPMRVAYIDAQERYRFNNLAYERGFGLSREQIQGRTVRELLGEPAYRSAEPHIRAALSGKPVTFQSEMTSGDTYVCYEAHYIPQFAADGSTVLGFHAVVGDITRQKLEEKRLVELARVDTLTGVVNRAGFSLRLAEVMGRCRSTSALMALMYLDIDRFKQVNDRFGHNVGDALLRAFAERLLRTLRASDTVARLGGDEFTVIMESVPRPEIAGSVAAKIIQAMNAPFVLEQQTISVTTSIGLAFFQGGNTTAEALVKQADEMLYQAKGAGRNNVQAAPLALRLIEGGQA
jgi:diguanylate cyclase (GGDEF)-like protein/PAS domain S-box-containing protein